MLRNKSMSEFHENLQDHIQRNVAFALEEDLGPGDITAQLIPAEQQSEAQVITREDCVLCGTLWFDEVYKQLGDIKPVWQFREGDEVAAGASLVNLSGNTRQLLTGERTALNFLQTLSGTASLSRRFAKLVKNTAITVLDTRKTIPGLRLAQKYAVAVGGCQNHRVGLYDAFLIKENHIAACGGIAPAISQARALAPDKNVEIEVENLAELEEALAAKADIIMLDNFDQNMLDQAFSLDHRSSHYEISGNIDLNNLSMRYADKKHAVSSGALTKHCRAIDLSFRLM